MAFNLQETKKNSKIITNKPGHQCKVIIDDRFKSSLPEKTPKPSFNNLKTYEIYNPKEIEHEIALSFDRKDIVELTKILCIKDESPLYIKKTRNSPLYMFICKDKISNNSIKEKICIVETALHILINDETVELKDIARSFKMITTNNSVYNPPSSLLKAYHERLGLFENLKKTEEIIQRLKNTAKSLGYTK